MALQPVHSAQIAISREKELGWLSHFNANGIRGDFISS